MLVKDFNVLSAMLSPVILVSKAKSSSTSFFLGFRWKFEWSISKKTQGHNVM